MKNLAVVFWLLAPFISIGQISVEVERNQQAPLDGIIDFCDSTIEDWEVNLLNVREQPKPASDYGNKKEILHQLRLQKRSQLPTPRNSSRSDNPPAPVMLNNFIGNNSQGTPNDNHLAISNDGKIVSVVNTTVRIYDDTGTQLYTRGLSGFAQQLGLLPNISDPRVLYDPLADRFILMFFSGVSSSTSRIIVAFSQTNDPLASWNFYALTGNFRNDTTWSDYPIVTISENDFFMTFNHLRDGEGWQTGFRYSAIWQIDKARGYSGDTLQFNYWYDIKHNGKPIWSVCPVQPGTLPYTSNETFFLSVRPSDLSNDTVFLHTISDSYQSGNAQFSTKVLRTDVAYGMPPNASQKDGQYLATNDARVLCAMVQNDRIQYVQNCVDTVDYAAGIYIGDIQSPSSSSPVISGRVFSLDSADIGYPSIAYIGNNALDNRSVITCSYSAVDTFPGTLAFYRDANGNVSEKAVIKTGERAVNVLADSLERWGDYTGVQRKYNEPNTAWLAGSFVSSGSPLYRTWIAKVVNSDSSMVSGLMDFRNSVSAKIYPNPASEMFNVAIELPKDNFSKFAIYDANGKLVRVLLEDTFKAGSHILSFNTWYLSNGIYFLNITNRNELLRTEKIVIDR